MFVNFRIQKYDSVLDHVFTAHEHMIILYHMSSMSWVIIKFLYIYILCCHWQSSVPLCTVSLCSFIAHWIIKHFPHLWI